MLSPENGYSPTCMDVGCKLKLEFTPVREDGVVGVPGVAWTEAIEAGPPTCKSLGVSGTFLEQVRDADPASITQCSNVEHQDVFYQELSPMM